MSLNKQPLAEVFGYLPDDNSVKAKRYRKQRLCPFNNKVPSCTKDKAKDPLGVCSVNTSNGSVITCPVRFREDWLITDDAADFFFDDNVKWTSLTEIRLNDANGKSAGNIDIVLVAYDEHGKVIDFGSLEIQAVYISGNVREPFKHYMADCSANAKMDWSQQPNYPRPDFLSSSRKRLAPQLLFKGGILNAWGKKMAVALDTAFFETLPQLQPADKASADVAWLIYDLVPVSDKSRLQLQRTKVVYTMFSEALRTITLPQVGSLGNFINLLQTKVDEKLESPPETKILDEPLGP
ncbi:MAG: NotI family restriction endonuclease [Candidatus Dadabacteria bacterium]|nr:NotI family restriction endonuclease [Candidatus Dadabacteria bacterium]